MKIIQFLIEEQPSWANENYDVSESISKVVKVLLKLIIFKTNTDPWMTIQGPKTSRRITEYVKKTGEFFYHPRMS